MKTLLIIRHAKSSWDNANISDIDRPLNDRGRRDAPVMAKRLIKAGVQIERFVSSTAKRARQTAELIGHEFSVKDKEIVLVPGLYHAEIQDFRDVIAALDDKDGAVALFSHNPGITALVNMLTSVRLDNMPTCGIFAVKSSAEHWSDFISAGPEFWFFDYPKATEKD